MFSFYNKHNNNLYNNLVKLSRNIFFYKDLSLKDNFETRVILIFFHLSIILIKFKRNNKNKFPQKIYDNIFMNIEYNLRELGYGDVSVNKQMKTLNKIFYDILLKIKVDDSNNLIISKNIIFEHLFKNTKLSEEILIKINDYFKNFYDFTFELDEAIVLKGQINYKYK
tara:strand:- start:130 stop:633 length:504 start_codon:yes stop_codon:yes gene_type:complete